MTNNSFSELVRKLDEKWGHTYEDVVVEEDDKGFEYKVSIAAQTPDLKEDSDEVGAWLYYKPTK
jgi:hypothetical protein